MMQTVGRPRAKIRRRGACVVVATIAMMATMALSGVSGASESSSSGSAYNPAAAIAANAKAEIRPETIGSLTKITKPIPANKVIDRVECNQGSCLQGCQLTQAAAAVVHWTVNCINAGSTPQEITAAFTQAVQNKPDAVIVSSYSSQLYEPQLQQLHSMGIPVIAEGTSDTPQTTPGITASVFSVADNVSNGVRLADYMLAENDGKPFDVVNVYPSIYSNLEDTANGLTKTVKSTCKQCQVSTLSVPASSIGTDLPSRVTSYLQAHPNVKWVYAGFGDMVTGWPTAFAAAGLNDVKVVTTAQTSVTEQYLRSKTPLVAVENDSVGDLEYRDIDFLIRHFTGSNTEEDATTPIPSWTTTAKNVPSGALYTSVVPNYVPKYTALWK